MRDVKRQGERACLPLGDEEDGLELELTFDGEMLDGEVFLPVVGQALVERCILLLSNLGGVASPDGLRLVELLILNSLLLNSLLLLGLLFLLIFVDFLNLGLLLVFLLGLLLLNLLFFLILNLLLYVVNI